MILGLLGLLFLAAPAPSLAQLELEQPQPLRRVAAEAPLDWEPTDSRTFLCRPGVFWTVTQERAVTGRAEGDGISREIQQTRMRIALGRGAGTTTVGYLQHVNNTQVRILGPEDSRLADPGPSLSDSLRPWPNTAGIGFYDLSRSLDLNRNNTNEIVFKRFATIPDPAASALVLVEADSAGYPRLVEMDEFVGTVRFEEGKLSGISWEPEAGDPVLDAEFTPLYKCRFIAQLGIRGQSACDNCCNIPVILRADETGVFRPVYEREIQKPLLERLRADLQTIMDAAPDSPLSLEEQAAVARAGAFFYLTGSGWKTRSQLEQALGSRAEQVQVSLLLNRLDEYFLKPAD